MVREDRVGQTLTIETKQWLHQAEFHAVCKKERLTEGKHY